MTRAAGRAQSRRTPKAPAPGSPEGRELGLDDRDIPGGLHHLVQQPAPEVTPPVPETPPYFRGDMAHGVPAGHDKITRPEDRHDKDGQARRHGSQPVRYEPPPPEPDPLPVYIVERREEKAPRRREALMGSITVAAQGGEPTRICSVDPERVEISLLNEDPVNVIRFASTQAALASGDAAALPAVTNSYLKIVTQGELWAWVQAAVTARLSVIIETEIESAAR